MRKVCCVGDMSTGHDQCAPVPAVTGSPSMDINGDPVVLVGDKFATHSCKDHPPHQGIVTEGSSLLDVNGIPVALVGHTIGGGGCTSAHKIAEGASSVEVER